MLNQETVEVFALAPVTDAFLKALEDPLLLLGGRKPSPFKDDHGRQGAILVVPTAKRRELETLPLLADLQLDHRETVAIPVKANEDDARPVHSINSAIEKSAEEVTLGLPAGGAPPDQTGAQIRNTDEPRNSLQTPDEEAAMYALRTASPSPATLQREILGTNADDRKKEAEAEVTAQDNLTKMAQALPIPSVESSQEPSPAALVAEILGPKSEMASAEEEPSNPAPEASRIPPELANAGPVSAAQPEQMSSAQASCEASVEEVAQDEDKSVPMLARDEHMVSAVEQIPIPVFVHPDSNELPPQFVETLTPSKTEASATSSPNKTTEGSLGAKSPVATPSPILTQEVEQQRDSTSVSVRDPVLEISADDPIRYLFRPTLLFLAGIGAVLLQMGGRFVRFLKSLTQ